MMNHRGLPPPGFDSSSGAITTTNPVLPPPGTTLPKTYTSVQRDRDDLNSRLEGLSKQQKDLDIQIGNLDRQMKAELKKAKNHSADQINKRLRDMEWKRSTSSLSLSEERSLLKQMDKLKADRRILEHVETLRSQKDALIRRKDQNSSSIVETRSLRKNVDISIKKIELMERISASKGGVLVTEDMLVERVEVIPKDQIGQFVGKMGCNLNKLEQTHFVALDVSNNGCVTIAGIEEDVDTAAQSIAEFSKEVCEDVVLSATQLSMLKGNKGAHLKNIEQLLNVSLVIVPSSTQDGSSTLRVRGLPRSISRAREAISEASAKTETVTVVPNGAFLRKLFSQGGSDLHELENSFHVSINVKRNEGHINVTGSVKNVDLCCQKLRDMAPELEEESHEIELQNQDLVSVIIGKKGQTIRKIQTETGCNIFIQRPPEGSTTNEKIVLRGPSSKILKAKEAIDAVLLKHSKENVTLKFPERFHSALYGQGGAVVKAIQQETKANITLQRREARSDGILNVFVRGEEEAVQNAVAALNNIVNSQSKIEIPVPEEAKSTIIGQKGCVISKMQKESGANISIQNSKAIIRGTREQVEQARLQIENVVAQFRRENTVLLVLSTAIGTLIGKGGSTLKRMREETGAQIEVSMSDGSSTKNAPLSTKTDQYGTVIPISTVTIKGQPEALGRAVNAVTSLMSEYMVKRGEEEDFRETKVRIPTSSPDSIKKLVGRQGETIRGIESKYQVKVVVERNANVVKVRGRAGPEILEATRTVQMLLEQGVHSTQVAHVSKRLARTLQKVGTGEDTGAGSSSRDLGGVNALLKRVQDETGTTLTQSEGDDFQQITIDGPAAGVRLAKEILEEMEHGIEREALKLPRQHLQMLEGDGETNVRRLESQYNVTIRVDLLRQLVRIIGTSKALQQGKSGILRLVRFFFPDQVTSIPLPSSLVISQIIGRKGANIRKLQSEHAVNVNIDRENNSVDVVGSDAVSVLEASKEIQRIVETWKRENGTVLIPRESIASIIGKKGASIRNIREASGVVSIDVDRAESCLRIRGEPEAIELAIEIVKKKVELFEKENQSFTLEHDYEIPWVIGYKGNTIRSIQQDTGCRLYVDKSSLRVLLQGSESSIALARSQLEQAIKTERENREAKREEEMEKRHQQHELQRQQRQREKEAVAEREEPFSGGVASTSQDPMPSLDQEQQYESKANSPFTADQPVVATENFSSYLSSLNVGTPIEMDTTALRHSTSSSSYPLQLPSSSSNSSGGSMGGGTNRMSGSQVMSMLLGDGAARNGDALLQQQQHHQQPQQHQVHPPPAQASTTPSFGAPPGFSTFLSATSSNAPTGTPPPGLDYSSFGSLQQGAFGSFQQSFSAPPLPDQQIHPSQHQHQQQHQQQREQQLRQQQEREGNGEFYYQGDGGYTVRLS